MLTSLEELWNLAIGEVVKPKFDYKAYLRSDKWKKKRKAKLRQAEYKCQICYESKKLNVHHRTYARIGNEKLSDLTVLCEECHTLFHNNGKLAKFQFNN